MRNDTIFRLNNNLLTSIESSRDLEWDFQQEGSWLNITGNDSQLFFDIKRRLKKGIYKFEFSYSDNQGQLVNPKLYLDYGKGFNEGNSVQIPKGSDNELRVYFFADMELLGIRFDLSESAKVALIPLRFELRRVNVWEIFSCLYNSPDFAFKHGYLLRPLKVIKTILTSSRDSVLRLLNNGGNERDPFQYEQWIENFDTYTTDDTNNFRHQLDQFDYRPLLSILLPTYNSNISWLAECIESVFAQVYENWELCISDDNSASEEVRQLIESYARKDHRIRYTFRKVNGHISANTNTALSLATGEYILLLDHDDTLSPLALFRMAEALNTEPGIDFLYSDEDKIDEDGRRCLPFFKPDWSPDLFYSQNYITHLVCIRNSKVIEAGGFTVGMEGSQDYDLFLKILRTEPVVKHVPHILYHWRLHRSSTSYAGDAKPYAHAAGFKALESFFKEKYPVNFSHLEEGKFSFTYNPRFRLSHSNVVSVIIPTKDRIDLLSACVSSILRKSTYPNIEIIIINNNSTEAATVQYFQSITDENPRVKVVDAPIAFNWSKLNNLGFHASTGEYIIFLNNDTEIITENWIELICERASLPHVGAVGVNLLYADLTIQHAGVVVGMGGWADHVFKGMAQAHFPSPFASNAIPRNVLAVTGACIAIKRNKFSELGLFDESFEICGSDVELCIRAYKAGYFNVNLSNINLLHHESKTRSAEVPANDFTQSALKYEPYRTKQCDPFFNPNLSVDFTIPRCKN